MQMEMEMDCRFKQRSKTPQPILKKSEVPFLNFLNVS